MSVVEPFSSQSGMDGLGLRMESEGEQHGAGLSAVPLATPRTPLSGPVTDHALDTPKAAAWTEQRAHSAADAAATVPPADGKAKAPPRPKRANRQSSSISSTASHTRQPSQADEGNLDGDVHLETALRYISRVGTTHLAEPTGSSASTDLVVPSSSSKHVRKRRLPTARRQAEFGHSGPSAYESARLQSDFRRALTKVPHDVSRIHRMIAEEEGEESGSSAVPSRRPSTAGSNGVAASNDFSLSNTDADTIQQLLAQARMLSQVRGHDHPIASVESSPGLATPPFEAIKRAIADPTGSGARRKNKMHQGFSTSASTPEGAIGKIALPPVHDDLLAFGQGAADGSNAVEDDAKADDELVPAPNGHEHSAADTQPVRPASSTKPSASSTSEADLEALRAGLRFVLGCYDDVSQRVRTNKGFSDAIITSIVAEGQRSLGKAGGASSAAALDAAKKAGAEADETGKGTTRPSSINHEDDRMSLSTASVLSGGQTSSPRVRLRTGSILRALARGKPSSSSAAAALSANARRQWGGFSSGLSSPARATQMDFDASPDLLIGPSNRLGMAQVVRWQTQSFEEEEAANSGGGKILSPTIGRVRTLSNATSVTSSSPAHNRSSRIEMSAVGDEKEDGSSASTSQEVRQLQQQLAQMQKEKQHMATEMEALSERLFAQANSMVKHERVKCSALEKELESLKLAMSSAATKREEDHQKDLSDIEAGAQNETEEMMMEAVAQASRDCAAAEDEAEEWRNHCDELEERIAIIEEALYNSMSLLAETSAGQEHLMADVLNRPSEDEPTLEGELGLKLEQNANADIAGADAAVPVESASATYEQLASLVIPRRAFTESNSSFYSADENDGEARSTVETSLASKSQASSPASSEAIGAAEDDKAEESNMEVLSSPLHIGPGQTSDPTETPIENRSRRKSSVLSTSSSVQPFPLFEANSAASSSSHRSSFSNGRTTSPRASSGVSSKRQSRQGSLPPRLPEPVSPLPSIPSDHFSSATAVIQTTSSSSSPCSPNSVVCDDDRQERQEVLADPPSPHTVPASVEQPSLKPSMTPSVSQRNSVNVTDTNSIGGRVSTASSISSASFASPRLDSTDKADGGDFFGQRNSSDAEQSEELSDSQALGDSNANTIISSASSPMIHTPDHTQIPGALLSPSPSLSRVESNRSDQRAAVLHDGLSRLSVAGGSSSHGHDGADAYSFHNSAYSDHRQSIRTLVNDIDYLQGKMSPPDGMGGIVRRVSSNDKAHKRASLTLSTKAADDDSRSIAASSVTRSSSTSFRALRVFGRGSKLTSSPSAPAMPSKTLTVPGIEESDSLLSMSKRNSKNLSRASLATVSTLTTSDMPSSPPSKSDHPRRRGAREGVASSVASSQGGGSRKSARSAILGHMPPMAPQGSSRPASSIYSGRSITTIESSQYEATDDSSAAHEQQDQQRNAIDQHYLRIQQNGHHGGSSEPKGFGRRRRFNEQARIQAEM